MHFIAYKPKNSTQSVSQSNNSVTRCICTEGGPARRERQRADRRQVAEAASIPPRSASPPVPTYSWWLHSSTLCFTVTTYSWWLLSQTSEDHVATGLSLNCRHTARDLLGREKVAGYLAGTGKRCASTLGKIAISSLMSEPVGADHS